jgi:hypothetical protein
LYEGELSTISGNRSFSVEQYVKGLSVIIRPSGNEREYGAIEGRC